MSDDIEDYRDRADLAVGLFGGEAEQYAHTVAAYQDDAAPAAAVEEHLDRLPELWERAADALYRLDDPMGEHHSLGDAKRIKDRLSGRGAYADRDALQEAYREARERVRTTDAVVDAELPDFSTTVEDEVDLY